MKEQRFQKIVEWEYENRDTFIAMIIIVLIFFLLGLAFASTESLETKIVTAFVGLVILFILSLPFLLSRKTYWRKIKK